MRRTVSVFILVGICAATAMWLLRRKSAEFKSSQAQLREWTEDWAGLHRYQAENASLKKNASSLVRPEAVFIGDSITEFWDLGQYFKGHNYINRGVQKQTTAQMLIRFRQDVLELRPCSVVILAGTGDIAGNAGPATLPMIENNLQSMVELAKANDINVFVASLLPVHDYGHFPATPKRPPQQLATLNAWIQDYCRAGGCYFVDYWSSVTDTAGMLRRELSDDGVHPNAEGYRIMTKVVGDALKQSRCYSTVDSVHRPTQNWK